MMIIKHFFVRMHSNFFFVSYQIVWNLVQRARNENPLLLTADLQCSSFLLLAHSWQIRSDLFQCSPIPRSLSLQEGSWILEATMKNLELDRIIMCVFFKLVDFFPPAYLD